MAENCILDNGRECLGMSKAQSVEASLNDFKIQNTNTHARLFDKVGEVEKKVAKLETMYNSLEGLPSTITNLDKTITIIGNKLESMDHNLRDMKESISEQKYAIRNIQEENRTQNENIDKIDNKSKIDWQHYITQNFWKIILLIGVAYAILKGLIERGI